MTVSPAINSSRLTHPKYRADVDGLRAIAVLSVVGFHAFPKIVEGGFLGVDIFFVISGYLISSNIFENLERNSFSYAEFYARRIKRIFPALIVVFMASYVFGWFTLLADEYKQLGKHIAAGSGFVSNLILWNEAGYFDTAAEAKPLLHLWSLGIEEQFYILWPLLLGLVWKRRLDFFALTVLVALGSFAINAFTVRTDPVAAFYSPLSRFWELMVGGILAYLALHKPLSMSKYAEWQSAVGLCLIGAGLLLIDRNRVFPGWWALLPTFGAFFIISAKPSTWVNRNLLGNPILVAVGLISYPLYLWHWPLLSFARILESGAPTKGIRVAAVVISIALAWLTYLLLEKPIRSGKRSSTKVVALCSLLSLVGFAGYNTYERNGLDFRKSGVLLSEQRAQFLWDVNGRNRSEECLKKYGGRQYCNITDIVSEPDVALIGDSHANHFFWGLSEYYRRKGLNLLNLGVGGCAPFLDVDRGRHPAHGDLDCYKNANPLYEFVLRSQTIKTVVLSFNHNEYFRNDVAFIDRRNVIRNADNYRNVEEALLRTIREFEAKGKSVIILYDMPDLTFDPKSCFLDRSLQDKSARPYCSDRTKYFVQDFDRYDLLMSKVGSATHARVFFTHNYLDGNFPVSKSGIPTYRDSTHLSIAGSMFFADRYDF